MSLTSNNASLQQILESINDLPDAENSGVTLDTCTVTMSASLPSNYDLEVYLTIAEDGNVTFGNCSIHDSTPVSLENVLIGTPVSILLTFVGALQENSVSVESVNTARCSLEFLGTQSAVVLLDGTANGENAEISVMVSEA